MKNILDYAGNSLIKTPEEITKLRDQMLKLLINKTILDIAVIFLKSFPAYAS